jgi:hypothetical protein
MRGIYDQIISKSNELKRSIWITDSATWPTDDTQKYFDWLQSTVPANTWNVTANYMYSKIDFILNG